MTSYGLNFISRRGFGLEGDRSIKIEDTPSRSGKSVLPIGETSAAILIIADWEGSVHDILQFGGDDTWSG